MLLPAPPTPRQGVATQGGSYYQDILAKPCLAFHPVLKTGKIKKSLEACRLSALQSLFYSKSQVLKIKLR